MSPTQPMPLPSTTRPARAPAIRPTRSQENSPPGSRATAAAGRTSIISSTSPTRGGVARILDRPCSGRPRQHRLPLAPVAERFVRGGYPEDGVLAPRRPHHLERDRQPLGEATRDRYGRAGGEVGGDWGHVACAQRQRGVGLGPPWAR